MFSNCHGTTFADGKFWINNEAVDRILKDEYTKVSGPAKIGDVVIYRNSAGTPVHSVTVTEVDSAGTPTKAKGEAGLQTEVKETAVGPGPGTAWRDPNVSIEIYRKSQPVPLPQKQRDSRFQYQKNN
jgi:hypothetical protein